MSGKQLINNVDDVVDESLIGLTLTYPALVLLKEQRIVLKPHCNKAVNKVGVISGGGSGHEPFAAGFVGEGMLTAAVCGSVFASPPSSNVRRAIEIICANHKKGCLVIVPNYTGDCLNFGLAIERSLTYGRPIDHLVYGDDCGINDRTLSIAGKRALPGIALTIKVAGSLAGTGMGLDEVSDFARIVADGTASCSVGLTPCTMIGRKEPMFKVADDEVVYGQGIHGEDGYEKQKLSSAADTVTRLIVKIEQSLGLDTGDNENNVGLVLLVNNFGGTSQLELQIVVKEAVMQLSRKKGRKVERVYAGHLMTSLSSAGIHLTILKLPSDVDKSSLIIQALDEPTQAPGWTGCDYSLAASSSIDDCISVTNKTSNVVTNKNVGPLLTREQRDLIKNCLIEACRAIADEEKTINELDSGCGDGDCGSTHKSLAGGIIAELETLSLDRPASLLSELATIAEKRMGGTSGAIYSLLFTAAAQEIGKIKVVRHWIEVWLEAWRAGLEGIKKYSKARIGDKTLIDVIEPCLIELAGNNYSSYVEVAEFVIECVQLCAEKTKDLVPKAGRASYVTDPEHMGKIDAGAYAAAQWMKAVARTLVKDLRLVD